MLCPRKTGATDKGEPTYCPGHMDVLDGVSGHGVHIRLVRCNLCGLEGNEEGVFTNSSAVQRVFRRMKAEFMAVWRSRKTECNNR